MGRFFIISLKIISHKIPSPGNLIKINFIIDLL